LENNTPYSNITTPLYLGELHADTRLDVSVHVNYHQSPGKIGITPRTPRKSRKTLERFLEFIEQKKAGEEWEGELEGKVFGLLEEWKKRRSGTCTVKAQKSYTREFKLQTLTHWPCICTYLPSCRIVNTKYGGVVILEYGVLFSNSYGILPQIE